MAEQLALDLPVREALGREDFLVAPANALALDAIDGWRDWPGGKLVLIGPEGSGKTHLAHVWAAEAGACVAAARALGPPERLAAAGRVVVEDAERIAGDRAAEEALFHLHNMLAAADGRLLVTARCAPARWSLALPDLASRMQAAGLARLEPPDDALLSALLVKLFADRQIAVSPALVRYLLPRMERSFAAARALVAALDARALRRGRPVTRALAAELLDSGQAEGP